MRKFIKISVLVTLSLLAILVPYSCKSSAEGGVSQAEYDALKAQLDAAQARIAELEAAPPATTVPSDEQSLRDEITSLNAQIAALENQVADLDNRNDTLIQEKASLEAQYEELNAEYEDVQATLAALARKTPFNEDNIEAEIMSRLNDDRVAAGINKFLTGEVLYKQAKRNSQKMAESGKVEIVSTTFYQVTFWAAGYDTVEAVARGALLTWKIGTYPYEHNVLFGYNKFGAVGAVISGDIVYITLLASPYP
jgi:peptidoglycan hydrolase CwlO-like protein